MVIIDHKKAKEKFIDHLKEIKKLQKLDYKKRGERIGELNSKIESLINVAFEDNKEKLDNYRPTPFYAVSTGMSKAEVEENSRNYSDRQLKMILNYVIGYCEELDLIIDTTKKSDKLSGIEKKLNKTTLETNRREEVAKSKFFGAVMELLDFQRNELKGREETAKEISGIKIQLQNIEDMLTQILKKTPNKS